MYLPEIKFESSSPVTTEQTLHNYIKCKIINLFDKIQAATVNIGSRFSSAFHCHYIVQFRQAGHYVYFEVAYRNCHSREVQTHASLGPTLAHVEMEVPDTVIEVSQQCLVKLKMKV